MRAYAKPGETPLSVLVLAIVLASALCAEIISLGVQFMGLAPFSFLANIILMNNIVMSLVLAPLLVKALQKRIRGMKMEYTQILGEGAVSRPVAGKAGALILLIAAGIIYAVMMIPAFGQSAAASPAFQFAASLALILASLVLL